MLVDAIIPLLADVFTIAASAIAVYLFVTKREVIGQAFRLLMSYSLQTTLTELKAKLERLNDLHVSEPEHVDDIVNLLNDIVGQIRGHRALARECHDILPRISAIAKGGRRLTEPNKRSLISELREIIKHFGLRDYADMMGEHK